MIAAAQAFIAQHQAIIGLVVLALMFVGFVMERFPATVVAILGTCTFLFLGILSGKDLFSVFSNSAPVTIGAMFILSGALLRTGTLDAIANRIIARAQRRPKLALAEMFFGVYVASAFLNNTPVVVVMIPIMLKLASALGISAKRLLMPLSFVCILGGTTTLIGTSTNLLVAAVAQDNGLDRFGIFTITPVGLVAGVAGTLALLLIARRFLPDDSPSQIALSQEHRTFLSEVRILKDGNLVGRRVGDVPFVKRANVKLVAMKRGATLRRSNLADDILEPDDRLVLRLELAELLSLRANKNVAIGLTAGHDNADQNDEAIVEAMIAPSHPAIGRRLIEIPFLSSLKVRILGMARFRKTPGPDLPNARVQAIDRVLVTGPADQIEQLYGHPHLYGVGSTSEREFRRNKAPIAIGALVGVILLATFNVMDIGVAAIIGVGLILVTRCIDADEAWDSIDGNVLVLIFAMLAVGLALENSGSVELVVGELTPLLRNVPPWGLVLATYVLSVLLTEIITNNAVAILVTPLAIAVARQLGVDPYPLVIAVMFAASASFATPIGYQTNTLVYAAGNYRFIDFFRAGIPLTLAVGAATCAAITFLV
ncbi:MULTISPECIES: SLC13 family permease [Sphingopyxis]|jgi:di/tricarboxylate transporter|uniref:SLC13 family permease n=1 Tax=Sphingopyxis TaxID=165697 RepID=UPI0016490BD7|nr:MULTISPECIES: SLC13 family permease [Sphingopyxis]QXF11613.1 SLC13 family permease [Sphingopyxis terrae subsp. terrae]